MDIILYILLFLWEQFSEVFFTLAVSRIPIGQDITHERSYCPNCNHKLSFLDMIPILSYIFFGWKMQILQTKNKNKIFNLRSIFWNSICFICIVYKV